VAPGEGAGRIPAAITAVTEYAVTSGSAQVSTATVAVNEFLLGSAVLGVEVRRPLG
jgi:hypothetical protein